MSIRLQVRWPNAGSPLLQNPTVTVLANDADVPAISQAPGKHEFDLPDGTVSVRVAAEFQPTLPVAKGKTVDVVSLTADQAYVVLGTTFVPDPLPFTMVNGEIISQNVHPLIDTISTGNAKVGMTIVEIRTEFVDMTEMWRARADQGALDVF